MRHVFRIKLVVLGGLPQFFTPSPISTQICTGAAIALLLFLGILDVQKGVLHGVDKLVLCPPRGFHAENCCAGQGRNSSVDSLLQMVPLHIPADCPEYMVLFNPMKSLAGPAGSMESQNDQNWLTENER